jgi:hypothetical protein
MGVGVSLALLAAGLVWVRVASTSNRQFGSGCPNPEGQQCLGKLTPGTYKTVVFSPTITYTVPKGWRNFEDTPGNFLLVPSRGDLPGVNAGTSDFVGIYLCCSSPRRLGAGPRFIASSQLAVLRRGPGWQLARHGTDSAY